MKTNPIIKNFLTRAAMTLGERISRPFTVMLSVMLMTAATAWADGAKTLPYSYGFENNDFAGEGWLSTRSSDWHDFYTPPITDYSSHSGNYSLYIEVEELNGQPDPIYLISPELDCTTPINVSFYFALAEEDEKASIQVGYSTFYNSVFSSPGFYNSIYGSFTWFDVVDDGNSWSFSVNEFPANTKCIAIRLVMPEYSCIHIDDILVSVSGCLPPDDVRVCQLAEQSATLTWDTPATSKTITGYAYQYKEAGESTWSNEVTTAGVTAAISGLTAGTTYDFRVKTLYEGGQSSDYSTVCVITECSGAESLPFTYDFGDGLGCYRFDYGSKNTGVNNSFGWAFSFEGCPHDQYLVTPQLDGGSSEITVSFSYRLAGSLGSPKYFQVGYSTTHATSAFTWGDAIFAGNDGTWTGYEHTFPAGTKYIAVKCNADDTDDYLDVNYFCIIKAGILPPAQPTVSDISYETATLAWTAPTTDKIELLTGYAYQIRKHGEEWPAEVTTVGKTVTSVTLANLTPDTNYEVRVKALYVDDESVYVSSNSFTTVYLPLELPYDMGFENDMDRWSMVDCNFIWDDTVEDIWNTGRRTRAAHDSNIGFQFSLYGNGVKIPQYLISPCFDSDAAINLSFYYRVPTNIDETIYVGYSTTTDDKDAFTFGDAITFNSSNWTKYEHTFPAGARYFAIKYTSNNYLAYIDDFSFEESSAYAKPTTIGYTALAETEVTMAWNVPDGATSFAYQYKKASDAAWSAEATLNNNTVTLSGLTPNTNYNFRVKALYEGNHASTYTTYTFQTDANVVDLPYSDGFENGMGGWRMRKCEGATEIFKTSYPHGGSYCFWFFDSDQHQFLLSPHFAGGTPMKVSFYYQNYENRPAAFAVGYLRSKDDDVTWVDNAVIARNGNWELYETFCPSETQYVIICCRKEGYMLYLDDFCFTEIPDIAFADNADNAITITNYSGEEVFATLQDRTLYTDGDWNTLCLPFAVSDFTGTPLEGATVKTLGSSAFSNGTLTLNFEDATSIEAGKPYIVKWQDGVNVTIGSTAEWNAFAESVNGGKSFAGKTVMLTSDISGVATMAGTAEHPFRGTFEGAGHTMNLSISGGDGAAPFHYINGATIRNVKTTGTVSGGNHSAGLVGIAQGGTNSIRDCYVDATVSTSGSYVGGILGNGTTSTTTISNCLFGGYIAASYMGILYGWGEVGGTHKVENCVAHGTYALGGSIDLLLGNGTKTVTNCWKNTDLGSQGDNSTYIYTGGTHPLVSGYLGSQWTYDNGFVLSPTVSVVDENIVNPVFTGVTIPSGYTGSEAINAALATASCSTDYVDFIGTYSPQPLYESTDAKHYLYLGADNTLYYPSAEGFHVNAFRAWFQLKNGLTAGEPKPGSPNGVRAFVLNFGDETTSLSEEIRVKSEEFATAAEWYTLDGRRLNGKPTRKGLYIHNGKKVVIK